MFPIVHFCVLANLKHIDGSELFLYPKPSGEVILRRAKGHSDQSLTTCLDKIGFTCCWAGCGELWRITDCWQPHYDGGIFWSNVACGNGRLACSCAAGKNGSLVFDTDWHNIASPASD